MLLLLFSASFDLVAFSVIIYPVTPHIIVQTRVGLHVNALLCLSRYERKYFPVTATNDIILLVFVIETVSVYCAVCIGFLYIVKVECWPNRLRLLAPSESPSFGAKTESTFLV